MGHWIQFVQIEAVYHDDFFHPHYPPLGAPEAAARKIPLLSPWNRWSSPICQISSGPCIILSVGQIIKFNPFPLQKVPLPPRFPTRPQIPILSFSLPSAQIPFLPLTRSLSPPPDGGLPIRSPTIVGHLAEAGISPRLPSPNLSGPLMAGSQAVERL